VTIAAFVGVTLAALYLAMAGLTWWAGR